MSVVTFAKEKPERQLASWIESFLEATDGLPVPRIFLKWAAISTIAGALERKVWVRMNRMNLYPNMYVLLIGEAGAGKTVSASQAEILWRGLKDHHIAPTNASKAALIDVLNESKREVIHPRLAAPPYKYNSLNLAVGELGALLPQYDSEFMNTLTTLWDCGYYSERKRGGELKIEIPNPSLNLLACCTPDFLNNFMPEGSWRQGFASRLLLVYSGDVILGDLWAESNHENAMGSHYNKLQSDLSVIGNLFGKMEFTPETADTFTRWYKGGMPPLPDHPKLESFIPRRPVHLAKICMVRAVSEGRMTILPEDFGWCLDTLTEIEAAMPDAFLSMKGGKGHSAVIDELWHHAFKIYAKEKKPIDAHRLVNFLQERVPSNLVLQTLGVMVHGGLLKESVNSAGRKAYVPEPKVSHY